MAGRNSFANPLAIFGDSFKTRPPPEPGGGKLNTGQWFHGDAALFGGVRWDVNGRLSLLVEYSSDMYDQERDKEVMVINSPFNFGLNYNFDNGLGLNAYYMYGSEVGVQFSYILDPRKRVGHAGQESSAPVLAPVDRVALASWNLKDKPEDSPEV